MSLKVWLPLDGSLENKGEFEGVFQTTKEPDYVDGKIGKCIKFDNTVIYNNTRDFYYIDHDFSWCVWIKHNYNTEVGSVQYAFSVGRVDNGGYGYGLLSLSMSKIEIRYGKQVTQINMSPDEWHHIAYVKSGNTASIYIDGVHDHDYNITTNPTYSDGNGLGIGCFRWASGNLYFYHGYLNDFRIYDHALSAKEVKEISKCLIAHYKLDNSSPIGIEKDVSGYGRDGVKNGDLIYSADSPRYVGCTGFWGENTVNAQQYIYTNKFDFLKDNFSLCLWLKMDMTKTGKFQAIISQGRDSNNIRGFNIFRNSNSDLSIEFGSLPPNTVGFGISVRDENWHHIVFTLSKNEGSKVFFDGKYITKKSYIEPDYTHAPKFLIGKMAYGYTGSTTHFPFNGNISDVRIYATALSEEDIKELYETSAIIDDKGNFFAYDFVESDTTNIGANGVVTTPKLVESDMNTETKCQIYSDKIAANQFIEL